MLSEAHVTKQFYSAGSHGTGPLGLSLFISPAAFIYSVSAQQDKTVTELCHVQISESQPASIKDSVSFLIQHHGLDRKKFEKVSIVLLGTDFAMIPDAYATPGSLKPLLKFTTGADQITSTLQHTVNGITFCSASDQELLAQLERTFPNAVVKHAAPVSTHLLFNHHLLRNCSLFLNLHDGFIELAAKRNEELLYYNIFNYSSNEDVLYYLLFMMEQFGLDPSLEKLGVAGQLAADNELMKLIKKYIRQVIFCTPDPSVVLTGELAQLPSHYYFTALNQHLCES